MLKKTLFYFYVLFLHFLMLKQNDEKANLP